MSEFESLVEALTVDDNVHKNLWELPGETEAAGLGAILDSDFMPFVCSASEVWPTTEVGAPFACDPVEFSGPEAETGWIDLRRRAQKAGVLVGWDGLPIGSRWQIAEQWDAQNRPRTMAEENEEHRHAQAGFDNIPVESVGLPTDWTVAMCCAWIATRDIVLVEHIWWNGCESAHWLNSSSSVLNTSDVEVLGERSHLLTQAGHDPLPSAGASLACLREHAGRGNVVVLGQSQGRGATERIPADAWANLRIVPSADGYQAQPQRQHYSSPLWSNLRVRADEVRKVWPDVPVAPCVEPPIAAEAQSPMSADKPAVEETRRSTKGGAASTAPELPSQDAVDIWYRERVEGWDKARPHPSRDDDQEAAEMHFEVIGLRNLARSSRRRLAPPEWTSGGPKGDKRPIRRRAPIKSGRN
jgi:hypothetical protein